MTEFLALSRVLKALPRDLPPVAVTMFIAAVEAKINLNAYEAGIKFRQDNSLMPRPLDRLEDPRRRALAVYETTIGILNLEYEDRAMPERPIRSWQDLIDEAAEVLNLGLVLNDATIGMPPTEEKLHPRH